MHKRELSIENIVDSLSRVLPALGELFKGWPIDESGRPIPYVLFDVAVRPFAEEALDNRKVAELDILFRFFEAMACSSERSLVNVLDVTILRVWARQEHVVSRAFPYMGPATRLLLLG